MLLRKGERVLVSIPQGEITASLALRKFDNKITTVKSVNWHRHATTSFVSYNLEGCQSGFGNYYEFCPDWLIPLDNEVAV